MQALTKLLAKLSDDLNAAILVVQHLSVDSSVKFLVDRLGQHTRLTCKVAGNGDAIEAGTLYMAPADKQMLIKGSELLVVRGPRENQFRPAIDPLFRSAAAYHGHNTIGVILTGYMSDGVIGMESIKRSGGTTVVQHPDDAEHAALPQNVMRQVTTDYIVSLDEMGELLRELSQQPASDSITVPADIWKEAQIAERVMTNSNMTSIEDLEATGKKSSYSCPECGGGLWEFTQPGTVPRFRCHTGHAYTQDSLLLGMSNALEETLWVAMRTLEERRNILLHMSTNEADKGNRRWATMQEDRAEEMKVHIERLRELLTKTALADDEHMGEAS